MRRRRLLALFLPALAILLVASSFFFLMHTGPGARWLLQRADGLLPGRLQAASVTGNLQSGLRLNQVRYQDDGLSVQVDRIDARLDFDLLPPSLAVHDLEFGTLEINSDSPGEEPPVSLDEVLEALALPLPIQFKDVRGERLVWQPAPDDAGWEIQALALSAVWFKSLEVEDVDATLAAPGMRWRGRIELGLQKPYPLAAAAGVEIEPVPDMALDGPVILAVLLDGDFRKLRLEVGAEEPSLLLSGTLSDLLDDPSWENPSTPKRVFCSNNSWPEATAGRMTTAWNSRRASTSGRRGGCGGCAAGWSARAIWTGCRSTCWTSVPTRWRWGAAAGWTGARILQPA